MAAPRGAEVGCWCGLANPPVLVLDAGPQISRCPPLTSWGVAHWGRVPSGVAACCVCVRHGVPL